MSSRATSAHRPQKQRRRQIDLRDPSNRGATDHELLANLLAYSQGRVSAEPLLQRFHSLGHVLSAEPAQLAEFGIEASDVTLLRLVRDIACRLLLGAVQSRPREPVELKGLPAHAGGSRVRRSSRAQSRDPGVVGGGQQRCYVHLLRNAPRRFKNDTSGRSPGKRLSTSSLPLSTKYSSSSSSSTRAFGKVTVDAKDERGRRVTR